MEALPSKVPSNDAMPRGRVLLIKLLFDVSGNILFNIEFLQCLPCHSDCVLLHFLTHIGILDDSFAFGHDVVYWLMGKISLSIDKQGANPQEIALTTHTKHTDSKILNEPRAHATNKPCI